MSFKTKIKRWGTYALGVVALAGGMIASNYSSVSAQENSETYLVREVKTTEYGSTRTDMSLFDISNMNGKITNKEDINAITLSSQSVRFSGGKFSYYRNKYYFKVDISNIDDFDFERDVVIGENTSGGTLVSSTTYANFTFYIYNSSGGIEHFLERTDLYSTINKILHDCARKVITVEDETVSLIDANGSISSVQLTHVDLDENNQMALNPITIGILGYNILNYDSENTSIDVNFYIRNMDDILFGTLDGKGENVYTEKDVNNAYNDGYLNGHSDGYVKGSLPTEDSNGTYTYIIEYSEGNELITIDESKMNANGLYTAIHYYVNSWGASYNWYDSEIYIDIDKFTSIEEFTYQNIIRFDTPLTNSSDSYFNYSNVYYYSSSNSSEKLLSFMNKTDFVGLSDKILKLLLDNEIIPLNPDVEGIENTVLSREQIGIYNFINCVQPKDGFIEVNLLTNYGNKSNIDINFHPHSNTGFLSVIKRSYDDTMYGVYSKDGDDVQSIGMYEIGFNHGYEAGLNAKIESSTGSEGVYTEEDLNTKYEEGYNRGYEDGSASVDIDGEYMRGYEDGVNDSASEYADRLEELDTTISNLNSELGKLQDKIKDYENTDDKYSIGYEHGYTNGHSVGYLEGFNNALDVDAEEYGNQKYQEGYTNGNSNGYSQGYTDGYNTAKNESDIVIGDKVEENSNLVEQVKLLQNDISNLNNRINSLTGTINSMNAIINTKYEEGYTDGVNSVDITVDNQEAYLNGYIDGYAQCELDNPPSITFPENNYEFGFRDGYANGYSDGEKSVDVTIDNEEAIKDYINNKSMKTEEEYLNYGEEKYDLGYRNNSFGNQVKRLCSNIGTFFVNLGKGIVQYVAFGWAWDKNGQFVPNF